MGAAVAAAVVAVEIGIGAEWRTAGVEAAVTAVDVAVAAEIGVPTAAAEAEVGTSSLTALAIAGSMAAAEQRETSRPMAVSIQRVARVLGMRTMPVTEIGSGMERGPFVWLVHMSVDAEAQQTADVHAKPSQMVAAATPN